MLKLSAMVVVSAAFALAACGGNSSEFTSSQPLAIDALPEQLASALCQAEQACDPFFYGVAFTNIDCKSALSEQLKEASFTQIEAAVTAKKVSYDGDKAAACVSAVSTGSCGVLDNNLPSECRAALAGSVATGGDCDIDAECSGSSRCQVTAGTCPGTCAPLASAGVACSADGDCALGLTCSEATQHCVTPPVEGEACKGGTAADCAAGLLCVGNDDDNKVAGSCKTEAEALTKKVGEACDLDLGSWCTGGASCVLSGVSPNTYECRAVAAPGGECGLGLPSQCPVGQYCPIELTDLVAKKVTANCLALPGEGAACGPALGISRCAGNLVCDDQTAPLKPVCVALHSLGESCADNSLCHSQHCVGNTCVPESPCAK